MGRFSSTTHIKNTTDKAGFIRALGDVMAKRGFVPCAEDEAAKSYLLAFSEGGWVTFASESDDVPKIAADMNATSLSVEVVDSDFAILQLHAKDGAESTVVVGDGSGYGVEKTPIMADMWKPLVRNGNVGEFVSAVNQENTFVEDTLCDVAPILGIDAKYIVEGYNELFDMVGNDESVISLSFRKASEKKLTLNAAFVKVFGEALEPLGFKKIKSKYPYFVRVVSDEIIHYVTVASETADGRGSHGVRYKCFKVFCGVSTVYNGNINFDENNAKFHSDFINSVSEIYSKTHRFDFDANYCSSIARFYYDPTDNNSLISSLKKSLLAAEVHALPVIGQAVTLEKCMDYYGVMEHWMPTTLGGGGEGLLCTKLFSADEYVAFTDMHYERELKILEQRLTDPTQDKANTEVRINCIMRDREEEKNKFYKIFTDPKLQEKAPAELERRKTMNTEYLRSVGLDI